MPEPVANASDALIGPARAFLAKPTQEGCFLSLSEEGVDLVVQVVGETPAGFAANCAECGHRSRFERGRVDQARKCALCRATLGALEPAREGEKFNVFGWRVAWSKEGFVGLGYGASIEEGAFTDSNILEGISQMHSVLRLYLPLFESLNVTTMKDYRALTSLRQKTTEGAVALVEPSRERRDSGASA